MVILTEAGALMGYLVGVLGFMAAAAIGVAWDRDQRSRQEAAARKPLPWREDIG